MTTITNPQIKTIIDFIARQMDGDQVPTSNSAELRELGLRALGIVIHRLSSNYEAERTLRNFITGGDRHA